MYRNMYMLIFLQEYLKNIQIGKTECLPSIYKKSKADANACLKKKIIL